jgi:hypothetical protein
LAAEDNQARIWEESQNVIISATAQLSDLWQIKKIWRQRLRSLKAMPVFIAELGKQRSLNLTHHQPQTA